MNGRSQRHHAWRHKERDVTTHLGEGDAVLEVDVLPLDITGDRFGLLILSPRDLEGHIGRSDGLNFQRCPLDGVVLVKQIRKRFAEVLNRFSATRKRNAKTRTFHDGGTG